MIPHVGGKWARVGRENRDGLGGVDGGAAAKGDDAVGIVSAEGGETGGDDVEIGVWRDPGEDGRG